MAARRKFYTAIKSETESVLHFSNRVRQLADTLLSMDVVIDDSERAMALLNGLPDRYHALISALDALGDEENTLSFNHVKGRVIQEEQRISMRNLESTAKTESAALVSQQSIDHPLRPQCAYRKKLGHTEDKCWKNHPHFNPHKKRNTGQAAIAVSNEPDASEFICLLTNYQNSDKFDHWLLDSGCSNHITHNKSLFQSYPDLLPPLQSSIEVGNGEKAKVMGKGSVTIYLRIDNMKKTCQLSNVLYAPDLDYNLISISTIDKTGITTIFRNSKCIGHWYTL